MLRSYIPIRQANKAAWLAHHETIWERMGLSSPWGNCAHPDLLRFLGVQHPEDAFNKLHCQVMQAVAQHGEIDTSQDFRSRSPWDFRVVADTGSAQGYKIQADFQFDKQAIWWGVLAAIIGIVITVVCPPLGLIAGLLGTLIVGVAFLIMSECVVDCVRGNCGAEQTGGYLSQLAAEAEAA